MNAWDNLPNAARIDAIRAHCKVNPDKWRRAQTMVLDVLQAAARDGGRFTAWNVAFDAVRAEKQPAVWGAADYAVRTLMAWDEAGELLDMPVEEVQALAMVGIHAAVLLLPAVIAMKEDK